MSNPIASSPVCIAPVGNKCGEGPVWHAAENALYWTDINRFGIQRYAVADGSVRFWLFDEPVTALSLTTEEDTILIALASGLMLWKPATDTRRRLDVTVPGWPKVRINDARPDVRGSLWAGTMRNNVNPDGSPGDEGGKDGALYRIDPDGSMKQWKDQIGIANTVTWSPDGHRFYFADTTANLVWSFDYDAVSGAISNEQTFFSGFDRGFPDGSVVDAEGCLWNCRHGGGCVVRVSPEKKIDYVLEVPARNVTSCTFGGPDLKTLFITSAALNSPAGDRLAGSLFACRTNVPGLPEKRFRITD